MKKLPDQAEWTNGHISVGQLLIGLFRLRCGSDGQHHPDEANDPLFNLVLRLCHMFAQNAESSLRASTVCDCPDPNVRERAHPFMQASRRRGNPSLKISTINKFQCRGGGFVSTKDEVSLRRLGIISKDSPFAARTGSEYAARTLQKSSDFLQKNLETSTTKVVNLAMDAATVSGEHVPWPSRKHHDGFMFNVIRVH